ncbi:hypothetical protein FDH48_gp49 [Arthrobacter phage Jawnski]|uniref:Uncharacterized protein n=3 Tax=Jawnskivirus TaxID=3425003 RepID=A0A222Z0S0_9CAUD|nr:hypothetical protein FDH47_gp50 [Arthrobacter phage Brent]YP_009601609.1 hypothetical protein FDH48_gp49 [Arthrobacter phage Jawnski]ALF01261.1 hypothetical protein SEA_BRENT_50 [Arthrobacter phage Brent]ALY09378.1 hypothetical protein JAWNSKI_49 [Arthrobacter phage Jawnski]ASR78152.1 hypothetical protein SEA_FRANZY_50 [Arthrobacter phage Franzy]
MKIVTDISRTVTRHTRTIGVEDGPIVPLDDSYLEGTVIKLDKISYNYLDGAGPVAFKVEGQLVDKGTVKDGARMRYSRVFPLTRIVPEVEFVLDLISEEGE